MLPPPAAPHSPGLGRILPRCVGGEQTRLYSRRFDPREGMKSAAPASNPAFLGWGSGVTAGWGCGEGCAGCRGGISPTHPKITRGFSNSLHRFGATSGHRSQPCCQQRIIFWEGGTETRGKAVRGRRRKKIRGRTVGRKSASANMAPFPPQP